MRALLLSAFVLTTTAASAQNVRIRPEVREAEPPSAIVSLDCGAGADMRIALPSTSEPVPMPDLDLSGPEPVAMPNVCAEERAPEIAVLPEADFDSFRNAPRRFRLREAPDSLDDLRDQLRQFHDGGKARDLLGLPPVAPPDDRP